MARVLLRWVHNDWVSYCDVGAVAALSHCLSVRVEQMRSGGPWLLTEMSD